MDFELLKSLCSVRATSGNEGPMVEFLLKWLSENEGRVKVKPKIFHGDGFQDNMIWVFGEPKAAIYAHIDSIGFTVRYDNKVVPIGGPVEKTGFQLVGSDSQGDFECNLLADDESDLLCVDYNRLIEPGTELTFKPVFNETDDSVQCCYLDNRLGVWVALQTALTLENGAICFTSYEEMGGGGAGLCAKYLYEQFGIKESLICDITWVTEGVKVGEGVAISLRDSTIPRKSFLTKILNLASESGITFQKEVEGVGGSDGKEIHRLPYPIDWIFIGAPEQNVHSPLETVHKKDIEAMVSLYTYLMSHL